MEKFVHGWDFNQTKGMMMSNTIEDKVHKKMVEGLGSSNFSPAVAAIKMKRESKYVNESMLQYITNYIIVMAEAAVIPVHLKEVQDICKALKDSLSELGLTGDTRLPVVGTEYLAV